MSMSDENLSINIIDGNASKFDYGVGFAPSEMMGGEMSYITEVLTRVEVDLAYAVEKLLNLNVFMMHLVTKESDFETIASEIGEFSVEKISGAIQFDLLYGILDSEVLETENFIDAVHTDINGARKLVSAYEWSETLETILENLCKFEESLNESHDQITEIRSQSAKFQTTLVQFRRYEPSEGNLGRELVDKSNINIQSAEEVRNCLRMLESSMAREIDLEKNLVESRKNEEDMKLRLLALEQEGRLSEADFIDVLKFKFEADNAAVVFKGISKELLAKLQILQLSLNGSLQREAEMKTILEGSFKHIEVKDRNPERSNAEENDPLLAKSEVRETRLQVPEDKLTHANSEISALKEKIIQLESQLNEPPLQLLNGHGSAEKGGQNVNIVEYEVSGSSNAIEDLKEKLREADNRANNFEVKCKTLEDAQAKLFEENRNLTSTCNQVESLEKQLDESDRALQHALASEKASQEKQCLLNSTIEDMKILLGNLKSKYVQAEIRAENVERNCIMLSEVNTRMNEELVSVRGRLERVQAAYNHLDQNKVASGKNIAIRAETMTKLVMQVTRERERLKKEMSSLVFENATLKMKLHQIMKKTPFVGPNVNGESSFHSQCQD